MAKNRRNIVDESTRFQTGSATQHTPQMYSQEPPASSGAAPLVPGSDHSELIHVFRARLSDARAQQSVWNENAKRWYQTYANNPWGETKETLEAEGRMAINFNLAASTVNSIIGTNMGDRQEARFMSTNDDPIDALIADARTNLVRTVYKRYAGHRHESQALYDMLITGYGWVSAELDQTSWPFRVRPVHVPARQMFFDPDWTEPGMSDLRWVCSQRRVSLADAQAQFPAAAVALQTLAQKKHSDDWGFIRTVIEDNYGPGARATGNQRRPGGRGMGQVMIWDYQWYDLVPHVRYVDPFDGIEQELPLDAFEQVRPQLEQQWIDMATVVADDGTATVDPALAGSFELQEITYPKKVYRRVYLAGAPGGAIVLGDPEDLPTEWFTYIPAPGFLSVNTDGRHTCFGLLAMIHEPQLMIAKTLSLMVEMLGRSSKQGGFFEEDAVPDPQRFLQEIAKPGAWNMVSGGALAEGKIVERTSTSWPQGFDRLLQLLMDSLPQISAVTDYVKGTATTERSNVLISNLQQQAMTVLNPIYDSLSLMKERLAQALVGLATKVYDAETLDALSGRIQAKGITFEEQLIPETGQIERVPTGTTAGQLLSEVDPKEIDVVVDLGTAGPTAKSAIWQFVTQALKPLADSGFPVHKLFPLFVAAFPGVPETELKLVKEEVERELEAQKQQSQLEAVLAEADQAPTDFLMQIHEQLMALVEQRQAEMQPTGEQPV